MLNYRKLSALGLIVATLSINGAFAKTNYNYTPAQPIIPQNTGYQQPVTYNNGPLKGSVVTVPAGTSFAATLTSELSSKTASVGQAVYLVLGEDFYYGDKLIAPSGSTISGSVIEVTAAKHGSINGKIGVRFTQLTTPAGMQIPISAIIKTEDSTGVLVGGTKTDVTKEYVKDLAVGSAAGALSGLVFGALAGGDSLGRGVALGTAVGAGGGLVKSVIDKGNDVEIPINSSVQLTLTQPITTSSPSYSYEN